MNTAFNLLRYPMQARQRRLRWRWGSAVLGLLAGASLGGAALRVVIQRTQRQALGGDEALSLSRPRPSSSRSAPRPRTTWPVRSP